MAHTTSSLAIAPPTTLIANGHLTNHLKKDHETILVVDDNADMRFSLSATLHSRYQTLEASNGFSALELAMQSIPDLIITDLMIPGMNGLQLCQQIKMHEYTNHIPVVILSDKADLEARIEGIHHGADEYFCKPFSAEEMQARIFNLIHTRKKLKEKFSTSSFSTNCPRVQSVDEKFMERVNNTVELHLDDPKFCVKAFAYEVGISNVQLYRKLMALTGFSPNDYIRHQRLQRASYLLLRKFGNVSEVAYAVGFNSLSYFSKCFREKYGCTPCAYPGKIAA